SSRASRVACAMDQPSTTSEIAAIRAAFARAWQSGQRPRIEDFLPPGDERQRDPLIKELIILDVRHRQESGESPTVADYSSRFPAQVTWLKREMATLLDSSPPEQVSTLPYGAERAQEQGNGPQADRRHEAESAPAACPSVGRY